MRRLVSGARSCLALEPINTYQAAPNQHFLSLKGMSLEAHLHNGLPLPEQNIPERAEFFFTMRSDVKPWRNQENTPSRPTALTLHTFDSTPITKRYNIIIKA